MVKPMYIHVFPMKTAAKLPDHWFNPHQIRWNCHMYPYLPKKKLMVESPFSSPLVHPSFSPSHGNSRPRRLHSSVPAMSSSQISRPGAESTAATAAKAWEALEVTPLGLGIKVIYPLS